MCDHIRQLMQDFQRCEAGDDLDGEEVVKLLATRTGVRDVEAEK